jgi:hypothetical protein
MMCGDLDLGRQTAVNVEGKPIQSAVNGKQPASCMRAERSFFVSQHCPVIFVFAFFSIKIFLIA